MGEEALLTLEEMAQALGKSVPTTRQMMKDGAPVERDGSNGRPYGLSLSAWQSWISARSQLAQQEDGRRRAMIAQGQLSLEGGEARGDHAVSADIRKEFYQAELLHNKVARERGELVEAIRLRQVDDLRMRFVATFLQGLPDYLAKRCTLDTGLVAEVVAAVDEFQERLARHLMDTDFLGRTTEDDAAMLMRIDHDGFAADTGGRGAVVSIPPTSVLRQP